MKLSALIFLLLSLAAQAWAQQSVPGKVSGGFQVPATRDNEGRRSVLKGSGGQPLGGGKFEITDARLTSFKADDTRDMIIEAPHCIFETTRNIAHSDSEISVQTADGRFSIRGVGWRWDSKTSQLVISNQVFATVRKAALAELSGGTPTTVPSTTNTTVEITSKTFMHQSDLATFAGDVVVEDGPDTLRCGRLIVNFEGQGGVQRIEAIENVHLEQPDTQFRGEKAVYSVQENTIEVLGDTSWQASDREGSSQRLILNRASQVFSASGDVFMKLPTTNIVSLGGSTNAAKNPGTARFLEIHSQKFTFLNSTNSAQPSHASYEDNVRVIHEQGEIRSGRLDITFSAADKIETIVAKDDVEISSGPNTTFGQEAVYELSADKLTITGNPRWRIEDKLGSGEKLILHPESREAYAIGEVKMTLPGEALGPLTVSTQTKTNTTANPLTILSDTFSQKGNIAVFDGDVRVADPSGTLACAMLTVYIGKSNQVQRIVAEDSIQIQQNDLLATGDRADYNLATGLVHLSGDPRVTTPGRTAEARVFIIDRNRNSFSMAPGDWRITMQPEEKQKRQ